MNSSNSSTLDIYESLDVDKHHIRLLKLAPSAEVDAPLLFTLKTVSLDDDVDYMALSYEWDRPSTNERPQNQVLVNGQAISVKTNLLLAMLKIRANAESTVLWIDAICINQQCRTERAEQVQLMDQIFRKAKRVIAWLGEADNKSDLAFDLFVQAEPEVNGPDRWDWCERSIRNPAHAEGWDALTELIKRSYFKRGWIIQEMILGKSMRLLCGERSSTLSSLTLLVNSAFGRSPEHDDRVEGMKAVLRETGTEIRKIHAYNKNHSSESLTLNNYLHELLFDFPTKLTSDPSDQIYSLLAVSQPYTRQQNRITVDYTLPFTEVYKAATEYIINGTQTLKILLEAAHHPSADNLPSWVPDWRSGINNCFLFTTGHERYSAGRNDLTFMEISGNVLKVKARKLGIITDIGSSAGLKPGLSREEWEQHHYHVLSAFTTWVGIVLGNINILYVMLNRGLNQTSRASLEFLYKTCLLTSGEEYLSQLPWTAEAFLKFCFDLTCSGLAAGSMTTQQLIFLFQLLDKRVLFRYDSESPQTNSPLLQLSDPSQFGTAGPRLQVGDEVMIIEACPHPMILRAVEGTPHYRIIGDAFLSGRMHGEALRDPTRDVISIC